jgi:hypothetical protein
MKTNTGFTVNYLGIIYYFQFRPIKDFQLLLGMSRDELKSITINSPKYRKEN